MGLKAIAKDRDGLAGGRGARTPRHCGLGLDQDMAQIRSSARTGKSRSQSLNLHCDLAKNKFSLQTSAIEPSAAGGGDAEMNDGRGP